MFFSKKPPAGAMSEKIALQRDVLLHIKELLIERLQLDFTPDDIDDDTFLFGSGLTLDSIDMVEIIIAMESRFDVLISDDDVTSLRTINTLADLVVARQAG